MLVEVLSHSTESFDRGDKFRAYRKLPSLTDGSWVLRTYDAASTLPIASLDVTLEVNAIYTGIELTEPQGAPHQQ